MSREKTQFSASEYDKEILGIKMAAPSSPKKKKAFSKNRVDDPTGSC